MVIHEVLPPHIVIQNAMPPIHGALQQQHNQQHNQQHLQHNQQHNVPLIQHNIQHNQQQNNQQHNQQNNVAAMQNQQWWQQLQQQQQVQQQQQQQHQQVPQRPKFDKTLETMFRGNIRTWMNEMVSMGFDARDKATILELFRNDRDFKASQIHVIGNKLYRIEVRGARVYIQELGTNEQTVAGASCVSFEYRNSMQPANVNIIGHCGNIYIGYTFYKSRTDAEIKMFDGTTGEVTTVGVWRHGRRGMTFPSSSIWSDFSCSFSADKEYCLVVGPTPGSNSVSCKLIELAAKSFVETINIDKRTYGVPTRAVFDPRPHRPHILTFIIRSGQSRLSWGTLAQYDVVDKTINSQYKDFEICSDLLQHTKDGEFLLALTRRREELWIFQSDDLTPLFALPYQSVRSKLCQLFPLMSKCGTRMAFVTKESHHRDSKKRTEPVKDWQTKAKMLKAVAKDSESEQVADETSEKEDPRDNMDNDNSVGLADECMQDLSYNVQVYKLPERLHTLQALCRKPILQHVHLEKIKDLPIPPKLQSYLHWQ